MICAHCGKDLPKAEETVLTFPDWLDGARGTRTYGPYHPKCKDAVKGEFADEIIAALRRVALARGPLSKHEVNVLLRACLVPRPGFKFACCDYSQVEARALAWAAGDEDALVTFRTPGADPYARLACRLFAIAAEAFHKKHHAQQRDTSKKAELGCGYGMGAPKFKVTAEKGGMVWKDAALCAGRTCTDPLCGFEETDFGGQVFTHGSRTIVQTWRDVHQPIVRFWEALQDAACVAAGGGRRGVGPYEFGKVGGDVWCMLPSGRPIVYPGMKWGAYFDTKAGKAKKGLHYRGTKFVEGLYGGLLAENVTQAFCRDLLARSLWRAEKAGLRPVLHVHDELVCEVPEAYAEVGLRLLEEIMSDLPAWAFGFPVAADGFICDRYRKG